MPVGMEALSADFKKIFKPCKSEENHGKFKKKINCELTSEWKYAFGVNAPGTQVKKIQDSTNNHNIYIYTSNIWYTPLY